MRESPFPSRTVKVLRLDVRVWCELRVEKALAFFVIWLHFATQRSLSCSMLLWLFPPTPPSTGASSSALRLALYTVRCNILCSCQPRATLVLLNPRNRLCPALRSFQPLHCRSSILLTTIARSSVPPSISLSLSLPHTQAFTHAPAEQNCATQEWLPLSSFLELPRSDTPRYTLSFRSRGCLPLSPFLSNEIAYSTSRPHLTSPCFPSVPVIA